MACNIGANDVANAMGTSVGAKSLTFKQAIFVAAIAEFIGAVFVGGHVSQTIRKGMIDPSMFGDVPMHLVFGMIGALLSAAVWLHLASYLGWPVSTTHSIVGGVVGFGIAARGMEAVHWGKVGSVVMSWVVSPVMGGLIAFFLFRMITRLIFNKNNPALHAKRFFPHMVFVVCVFLTHSIVYKGLKNLHLHLSFFTALMISLAVGAVGIVIAKAYARKLAVHEGDSIHENMSRTENTFKSLQIITAFSVAFAHGSNDVANAVGPLAAVVSILNSGTVEMKVAMPLWILVLGGGCIVIGLLIWGARVMATIGGKITELTPSRGFAAEFAAAIVVLICSKMGMPISTTHTLVGSVIGVGFARGLPTLNLSIVKQIVISWVSTVPFTAVISMIFYHLLVMIFTG